MSRRDGCRFVTGFPLMFDPTTAPCWPCPQPLNSTLVRKHPAGSCAPSNTISSYLRPNGTRSSQKDAQRRRRRNPYTRLEVRRADVVGANDQGAASGGV
jgi:hypothetical protein